MIIRGNITFTRVLIDGSERAGNIEEARFICSFAKTMASSAESLLRTIGVISSSPHVEWK